MNNAKAFIERHIKEMEHVIVLYGDIDNAAKDKAKLVTLVAELKRVNNLIDHEMDWFKDWEENHQWHIGCGECYNCGEPMDKESKHTQCDLCRQIEEEQAELNNEDN